MAHKTAVDLHEIINNAKTQVQVGGTYYHYKNPDKFYTLVDVILIEATEEAGVLYRAEYDEAKGIVFMRPITDFLAEVEVDGQMRPRFTLVV
jgi:hypothetical protein